MSTNSGEDGWCPYCGHGMSVHAGEWESKCRNCEQRFIICQERHAKGSGWRICHMPCGCGKKYYPDKAKAAKPLKSGEYAQAASSIGFSESTWQGVEATTQLVGTSSSHTRNPSADSVDPLQWTQARLESDGGSLLAGMAGLSVSAESSEQVESTTEVSARWNSDGKGVTLKSMAGDKVATLSRKDVVSTEEGYFFYKNGNVYFAKGIKPAKKR
ncbi:hypothetical protein HIM_12307 [Hirsutella minnesotensis 3608]|uniref:Uncharacterized protein n=1 Tax=Hirsutella minnesotensis 3608 TaxID=1043627 RepID=A0A0F8A085_9HYPO|nr:hypothetical protein HIM_12307 [Hirsutella minnesotensis 3608]